MMDGGIRWKSEHLFFFRMQILVGCLVLFKAALAFDFGDLFEQAFGGGGGGFQFEFGGSNGGFGGRQLPRAARFPGHIKNIIGKEFNWLRGTEWIFARYESIPPLHRLLRTVNQSNSQSMDPSFLTENARSHKCASGLRTAGRFT